MLLIEKIKKFVIIRKNNIFPIENECYILYIN
jgi:hypothetical protein